jgi:pimeloyl-ACP methyl ester carboxylesterase
MSSSRYAALIAALVLAAFAAFQAGAEPAGAASSPQMRFDKYMTVQPVCFTVTNPSLGQSTLYGQRFTDGTVSPQTPAIVLVHGIASSTANWDFSPTWSVARALAAKGYVVYSYDRLGYAKSSYYDHPGGGYTLTTSAHRDELHDIVTEVKSGAYTTTSGSDCSGAQQPSTIHNDRVVIIGHSAGGWIVAGYPGKYHDVAAMIQTDISGSISPPNAPLGSSTGGGFTTSPDHPDYFQFFQTSQNCRDFNTYTPGIVPYVVDIACAVRALALGRDRRPGGEVRRERLPHQPDRALDPRVAYLGRPRQHRPAFGREGGLRLLQGQLRLRRDAMDRAQHRAPVHGSHVAPILDRLRQQVANLAWDCAGEDQVKGDSP